MPKQKQGIWEALKPIFFPVHKEDNSNLFKGYTFAPRISHSIVCYPEDGGKHIVNSCSKDYGLVNNRTLLEPLITHLEKNHTVEPTFISHHGYSKFYLDLTIKDETFKFEKDHIFAKIRVNNSYDGRVKFGLEFGFYRVACKNGLTALIEGSSHNMKLRHTMSSTAGIDEKALDHLEEFLGNAPQIVKNYKVLNTKAWKIERAQELMEQILEETKFPKKSLEIATERLRYENGIGYPINPWLIYNAMNYALYNSPNSRMLTHKRDKVDAQVLHHIVNSIK